MSEENKDGRAEPEWEPVFVQQDGPQPEDAEKPKEGRVLREAYELAEWLVGVVVCVVLILSFVLRTVSVNGISMEPTLIEGDSLIATRLGIAPSYGDIVAITQPNASDNIPLIKRVIATGGQTIDIDFLSGEIRVDGELLYEPYIAEETGIQFDLDFPLTVPEGCVFVMGDNRNHSWDSRASEIGMIDQRYVLGKIIFRFGPFGSIGRP